MPVVGMVGASRMGRADVNMAMWGPSVPRPVLACPAHPVLGTAAAMAQVSVHAMQVGWERTVMQCALAPQPPLLRAASLMGCHLLPVYCLPPPSFEHPSVGV